MQINIVNVSETTKTSKAGKPYQALEVIYKDDTGKAQTKNLMSFSSPTVFAALKTAKAGDVIQVVSEKIGEYWQWTGLGTEAPKSAGGVATIGTPTRVTGSNYETAEERVIKQRYIVRQSSLSNAIAALSVGSKASHSSADIIGLAKEFEEYVFSVEVKNVQDLSDVEDDIPY